MLTVALARALRDAGVVWDPSPGDRFVVPERDLDHEVFLVSDMVIEVRPAADGSRLLAFNGTTEWALDSLEVADALWLPREDQLRTLLGPTFVSLERVGSATGGYAVTVRSGGELVRHVDLSVEAAYARALLAT